MTLPYDLAEKMKRLGFPQKGNDISQYFVRPDYNPNDLYIVANRYDKNWQSQESVKIPRLEEVLTELGDEVMLTNELGYWEAWKGSKSGAVRLGESGALYEFKGATPLEAACSLYVAVKGQSEI